ncbi:MAG: hypothetical protein ACRD1G_06620 [Acidimicrobiales bacterium]
MIVAEEQMAALAEAADEARIKALVAETPLAEREFEEARRHADAMEKSRADLLASIAGLQQTQDELLERIPESS